MYIEEYQRNRMRWKEVFSKKLPGAYKHTVYTTWEVSYRAIEHRNPYAAHLLALCGFFGPEDIPIDLVRTRSAANGMRILILENNALMMIV